MKNKILFMVVYAFLEFSAGYASVYDQFGKLIDNKIDNKIGNIMFLEPFNGETIDYGGKLYKVTYEESEGALYKPYLRYRLIKDL
jgi:hypothetical protein